MKILYFSISVMFLAVLCNAAIAHGELVPKTLSELYQEYKGRMIVDGQIISTSEMQENKTSYNIKILDYLTSPQQASVLTAVSRNENQATPIFHVGDNVQLYLDSGALGYTLSPYSFKTGEKCTGFGPSYLDFEPPFSAPASQPIRFVDSGGNVITPIVHQHNRMSYDIFNYSPLTKTTVDLQILLNDNPIPVFHDTQDIDLKPCTGKTMTWDFVPMQMGSYTDTIRQSWDVYENKIILGNYTLAADGFSPGHANTGSLSPLQQFKSGISPLNVKCSVNYAPVIKKEDDSPACVKPQTAQRLVERGWAISPTDLKPWVKIDTPSLNNTYVVNQPISFSVTVKGFGNYPCVSPQIKIHDNKNPNVPVFQDNGSTMSCPALKTSDNYSFDFPGDNSHYVIILNKTGDYAMTISYGNNSVQKYFSVVLPLNQASITILENNAGIVLLKSQTYYFETPDYTNDAYAHPVQVSFHDVFFTLFPLGFRGGLPSGGCMEKGPGLGQYYWTDAKFADDANELLHIFADSPSCTGTIPFMFSNHTNPQAGLTFYDGKMKLLVSTNVTDSTGHDIIIQPLGQTRDISNKTDDTKLQVHLLGGSVSVNIGSDKFNQTGFFSGNVGQVIKGLPVEISISDPYDMFVRKYDVSSTSISQDGSFNFTHTFIGKYDRDIYSLDFSYGNQKYELKYFPVVPP